MALGSVKSSLQKTLENKCNCTTIQHKQFCIHFPKRIFITISLKEVAIWKGKFSPYFAFVLGQVHCWHASEYGLWFAVIQPHRKRPTILFHFLMVMQWCLFISVLPSQLLSSSDRKPCVGSVSRPSDLQAIDDRILNNWKSITI